MSSCASRFKSNVSQHVNAFLRQDDILPYKEYLFLKSISSKGGFRESICHREPSLWWLPISYLSISFSKILYY